MHSSENARRSQRRQRPELDINTASTNRPHTARDYGTPRTPPSSSKPPVSSHTKSLAGSARALRVPMQRDAPDMETFFESIAPVDMPSASAKKENDRPPSVEQHRPSHRDSHDLSLPARQVTRDSLVTNMLLSLDQFSIGQTGGRSYNGEPGGGSRSRNTSYDDSGMYAGYGGGEDMTRTVTSTSRTGRHGYTYSSDLEGADDASRNSSQPSRGRRSNSSSGFQSSLVRINSMRESLHRGSQPGTPAMRPIHSRGGRGSKSSSANSIDQGYAQVLGSQRIAHGFGGRSSSFDNGHGHATGTREELTPWQVEFSNSFLNNEDLEAAPTPTVPVGPRRLPTMPSLPNFHHPEPMAKPSGDGKRNSRTVRSATVGRQAQPKINNSRDIPAVPAFDFEAAPAPHVGYEKAKEAVPPGPQANPRPPPPPKEKPGFFKRMFGGSSRNTITPATEPPISAPSPYALSESTETVGSRGIQKSQSTPPSRDSQHSVHGVLQKKPSSFFRRRKKSVNDSDPPPLPSPLPTPAVPPMRLPRPHDISDLATQKPQPSPVMSLRTAMNPYLRNGNPNNAPGAVAPGTVTPHRLAPQYSDESAPGSTPRQEKDEAAARSTRGFSPDYEPSPNARIRPVQPGSTPDSRGHDAVSSGDESPQEDGTPILPAQARHPPAARTGSFLADDSDDDDGHRRNLKQMRSSRHLTQEVANRKESMAFKASPTTEQALSPPGEPAKLNEKLSRRSAQTDGEDDHQGSKLMLPLEGGNGHRSKLDSLGSKNTKSATSLPSVKVGSREDSPRIMGGLDAATKPFDEPEFVVGQPTADDRQKAQNIFDGNEDFISKAKAAAWMGEEGPIRQRTLQAYMELYDFAAKTIVAALRDICGRLVLRAETQQVDRILVAFSRRWCECNPNHGFKHEDIIHTLCYSIILLQTDLHRADIESKMTRSQFVKNTMGTVLQALEESAPTELSRPGILPDRSQNSLGVDADAPEKERPSFRNSFRPPPRPESALSHSRAGEADDGGGPLVRAPFEGTIRQWEAQMEMVLKDIYVSIRDERLPLFGSEPTAQSQTLQSASTNNLSVMGMSLKRSPSVLSKAPSDSQVSVRGRSNNESARASNSRWVSKSRSRPRLGGTAFSSSRTSFDDGNSIWSPPGSSATWSRYSLGRTHASGSVDSFGSSWPRGDYQQSIGFANALSQAIIREDVLGSSQSLVDDEGRPAQLLDDESLELAGPPWVKEGMVTHKHHLDGIDKKAKDRNWQEVFAVVQKGNVSLFSFHPNKSMGKKGRGKVAKGAVVGGGNWQENATNVGSFALQQTLASALPPPGYSRSRPYVWALSLPTGAVHLFQVGTPEICKEFVTTANYWSARLSTHPLVGGISNIEYGWSDAVVSTALLSAVNEPGGNGSAAPAQTGSRPGSSANHRASSSIGGGASASASAAAAAAAPPATGRSSLQSRGSFRSSSFDFGHSRTGSRGSAFGTGGGLSSSTRQSKLPGDCVHIAEWAPPTQSLRPSAAPEADQLATLLGYVHGIEEELQAHNALRSPMLLAFAPRGPNAGKAMANWERKSSYLLREIVKFRTYVDCLQQAAQRRAEIYEERETARRAARGEPIGPVDAEDAAAAEDGSDDEFVSLELDREQFAIAGLGVDFYPSLAVDDPDETLRP